MNCRNHPTRAAVNTCSQCGDWLCEDCTADVGGRVYCASCLQKYWAHDHGAPAAAAPGEAPYCSAPARHPKFVSFGLLFFFSLMPPGVNYMYEGLIKRGLFMLSSFFLTSYLSAALHEPLFGLVIPIMWITCAFDAFRIRRRLIAGEEVPDSVDDILGFLRKYKAAVILFFVIVLGLHLLGFVGGAITSLHLPVYYAYRLRTLLPALIVAAGIYFIIVSGKHAGSCRHKDDGHGAGDSGDNK